METKKVLSLDLLPSLEYMFIPLNRQYFFSSSEIQYLHEINSTLKEEYDLQSNYENLSQKFKFLKKEEQDEVEKVRAESH